MTLPPDWEMVLFRDLGTWHGGATPSKSRPEFWANGDVPWLSPKDMGPDVLHSTRDLITSAGVDGSSVRLVPSGSIAVVVRSGILERTIPVALVPFKTTLNQDMKAVTPRRNITAKWIAWGLRSMERHLLDHVRKAGTTVASIEMPRFFSQYLPVPPLSEQLRIVEILEDHLSRLDAGSAGLRLACRRISSWYRASIDRLIWDGRFPCRPVGELLRETMRSGHSARASKTGQGIRALTLTAVTRNSLREEFTKIVDVDKERVRDLWLEPEDIFVQRSNTAELVGTTAKYAGPPGWAIFPDLLIRLRTNPVLVHPDYLTAAMRSERAHRILRARARGLAGSMPKIDQGVISELRIPLPPLDCQRELNMHAYQIEVALSRLLAANESGLRRAAVLRRSLLQAAFTGTLTGRTTDHAIIEEMAGV